jgi:hypothetical protein
MNTILSAGLLRQRSCRPGDLLRHRVMRHIRRGKFAPPLSVPRLPNRVQAATSRSPLVPAPCLPQTLPSLDGSTSPAEALAAITRPADFQLLMAPTTGAEPIRLPATLTTRSAIFWTRPPSCGERRALHDTRRPEGSGAATPEPSPFCGGGRDLRALERPGPAIGGPVKASSSRSRGRLLSLDRPRIPATALPSRRS